MLSLAAMAWREGALSADSRRGLLKVRSAGAEDDDGALQLGVDAYAPRLRARDASFEPLRSALDRGAAVRFDYITPGQHDARRRDVAPLALVQHGGRWMLAAHEFATDSDKNYLLARIVGPVTQYEVGQHTAPVGAGERTLAELERIWAERTARIAVTPGSDAERRLTRRRDTETDADGALVLHHVDPQILAEELAAFGPEVRVLEPDDLRARVDERLRALVRDHTDDDRAAAPERTPFVADAQPLQAQDKLAFLLALVPYLIDRERVSVAEAARHFGVPEARIRRAVELIAVSGVPGETMQYQHGDLFDIAWDDFDQNDMIVLTNLVAIDDSPRLSAREASALIAGLQYLSALPEAADRDAIRALMAKLSRGAGGAASTVAVGQDLHDVALATIRRAMSDGRGLVFEYAGPRTQGGTRRVDPLRVESIDTDWYLRAWDLDRQALRTFRLDRMSEARVDDRPAEKTIDQVVIPDTLFQQAADDVIVTVELDSTSLPLVADFLSDTADAPDGEGRVRIRLAASHGFDGVVRLVAGLPGRAVVLDPPAARDAVRDFAAAALAAG